MLTANLDHESLNPKSLILRLLKNKLLAVIYLPMNFSTCSTMF